MGIKKLNGYLNSNCSKNSIHKIHIQNLVGKSIVIDTSIYLYKYLQEENFLDSFRELIKLFLDNDVHPIFVFDGKCPSAKKKLQKIRKEEKIITEKEFTTEIANSSEGKKVVRVEYKNLVDLKNLMSEYNVEVVQAEWEADEICVSYMKNRKAWACLSDDMDMLVHGCERVIREFSTQSKKGVLYLLPSILKDLKFSMKSFREIMVLSGTDYNLVPSSDVSLYNTLKLYNKYISSKGSYGMCFYEWLLMNTTYIKNYESLMTALAVFNGTSIHE
jgi:5'-3' exonuclease